MNTHDKMTLQATIDQDGSRQVPVDPQTWSDRFAWVARVFVLMAVVAAPWMFGSVEHWSQFWISTALLLALALWWFETALNKRNIQAVPYVSVLVALGLLIGLFQLIPLSGLAGDIFLGRQQDLYQEFSLNDGQSESRPVPTRISLNTDGTWHQIRLLTMALTVLLLSCRYFRTPRDLTLFLAAMTVNGIAISIFGMIQKLTSDGTTLFWSFPLQLGGVPFGPYVNRNNSAGYLLICLACAVGAMYLALSVRKNRGPSPIISKEIPFWRQFSHHLLYFISELTAIKLASLIAVVFIAAGIVASLSRGAVLALLIAAAMTIFSYGIAKRPKNLGLIIIPLALCVVLLTAWLGFNQELTARFDELDTTQEVEHWNARLQTWKDTWQSVGPMGKFGSGLGTYELVSRLYRTDTETSAFTHAENQFVQALVESGWPGLAIYLLAWGLGFYIAYFLLRIGQSPATVGAGLTGVFLLWGQLVASCFDFGLYIPANTIGMAAVVGVISCYAHSMAYRLRERSFLRFQVSNQVVQVLLVILFAGCTMISLDLNRKSRIDALRTPRILKLDNFDADQLDERIAQITRLAQSSPSLTAVNELGKLGVFRARVQMFETLLKEVVVNPNEPSQRQRVWDETTLIRIQEQSESLRRKSRLSQRRFLNQDALRLNLPYARSWFEQSLLMAPLQPEVRMIQGEIESILYGINTASLQIERSIQLAPANVMLLRQATLLYLHAGKFEQAAPHLRRYLQMVPKSFDLMMQLTTILMIDELQSINYDLILEEMLPDNASLIYRFANDYAAPDSLVQKSALERAESLLETVSQSDFYVNVLRGRIKLAMGDHDAAIDYLSSALVTLPSDQSIRLMLVETLMEQERFDEALEHARTLIRANDQNRRYRQIFDQIKSRLDEQLKN